MTCASKASSIQANIWRGYSVAARILGTNYQFYRPSNSLLAEDGSGLLLENGGKLLQEGVQSFIGAPLFVLPVSLNAEDMNYRKPSKYGKATWYALVDGTGLKVGDYFRPSSSGGNLLLEGGGNLLTEDGGDLELEGIPQGTFYFIATMQPLLPILVVECNRTVSIFRPKAQSGVGIQSYGGATTQNQMLLASGVPCSILQGTKGEKSEANLPGDTRSPWWAILMPAAVGRIAPDDIITDDLGQRYIVSSNELTGAGYRITAMMAID